MYAHMKVLKAKATGLVRLARGLLLSATSLYPASVRSAMQRLICSMTINISGIIC